MSYSLFIDETLGSKLPLPTDGKKRVIVRNADDAIKYINSVGWPSFISFDPDYNFAKWIVDHDVRDNSLPQGFKFDIRGQNSVIAENIRKLLNNHIKVKGK